MLHSLTPKKLHSLPRKATYSMTLNVHSLARTSYRHCHWRYIHWHRRDTYIATKRNTFTDIGITLIDIEQLHSLTRKGTYSSTSIITFIEKKSYIHWHWKFRFIEPWLTLVRRSDTLPLTEQSSVRHWFYIFSSSTSARSLLAQGACGCGREK